MERIAGDPVTSAMWAIEALESDDLWDRLRVIASECLYANGPILSYGSGHLTWLAGSLEVTATLNETTPLRQLKFRIRVFEAFEDDEDGWYLASNMNHLASGGAYVYDAKSKSLNFVSYCALATWFDLALLLFAVRTALGQCVVVSGREDVTRFARCSSASRTDLKTDPPSSHEDVLSQRLWDMTQPDYIAGIWLSEHEREGVFERIADECPWVSVQLAAPEDALSRVIEGMDFGYQVFPDDDDLSVFNDNSSFSRVSFNMWTNFGRAIVTTTALPFFTHSAIFDDGASELEAVKLANLLNIAASEMCWQKLGVGSWFAKGSQICFATRVPHANLKPIVMGTDIRDISDVVFDIINPNMTRRVVSTVARELHSIGMKSQREPDSMDSMAALVSVVTRPDPVRVSNEEMIRHHEALDSWTFPSIPLLVYGVFNPVGSTMGSVELVEGLGWREIVCRYRHPSNPGQFVLATVPESSNFGEIVTTAIAELSEHISPPSFISIPADLSEALRESVFDGLLMMAEKFHQSGVNMTQRGLSIRNQPNPWWRGPNGNDDVFDIPPDLEGLGPAEIYLSQAMQVQIVDYNIGLFQAWWEGALMFLQDPDSPDQATRVVEAFTDHTLSRLRSKES